jgi:diguanylate cyclase (GGDEF)-like protein
MGFDQIITATMILAFVCILIVESRANEKLLQSTFLLTEEKTFLVDKLEKLSITDALTGLYNRRYFNNKLSEEYNRAKRNKYNIALVYIDIDNFKLINDRLGHPYGDKFLIYAADLFANTMKRANDTVFRLGGDEFVAILANSTMNNTKLVCEKIQKEFKLKNFPPINNKSLANIYEETLQKVSLSIGVIDVSYESSITTEDIVTQADKALYDAKNAGKNKIFYIECKN